MRSVFRKPTRERRKMQSRQGSHHSPVGCTSLIVLQNSLQGRVVCLCSLQTSENLHWLFLGDAAASKSLSRLAELEPAMHFHKHLYCLIKPQQLRYEPLRSSSARRRT